MHLENSEHLSLEFINERMNDVSKDKTYYVHCAGGYRSVIAASILKARGFNNLIDIAGGFDAIKTTDLPTTDFVCPTTL
jgi:hydroxyacylglutathione hydrolase